MSYEELVIDGILHWRSNSHDNWTPKTKRELTELIVSMREWHKLVNIMGNPNHHEIIPIECHDVGIEWWRQNKG